jgi:hypothetical protein
MKNKIQTIYDTKTQTSYYRTNTESAQHGTVVIYHFKKASEGTGAERVQYSDEYLKELIERGSVQWI